jgi:hypothetical protein
MPGKKPLGKKPLGKKLPGEEVAGNKADREIRCLQKRSYLNKKLSGKEVVWKEAT